MNRWHVYEKLKQIYMASGRIPTPEEINRQFRGKVDEEELEEGIIEFFMVVKLRPWNSWQVNGVPEPYATNGGDEHVSAHDPR